MQGTGALIQSNEEHDSMELGGTFFWNYDMIVFWELVEPIILDIIVFWVCGLWFQWGLSSSISLITKFLQIKWLEWGLQPKVY